VGVGAPAQGIADEIGVSKTTPVNWGQDLKAQVDNVRAMELGVLFNR